MAYAEKVYKVRDGKKTTKYTWRCRYKKPDGTWGSEPGFPTKIIAEKWGNDQEAAIREGRWADPELMRKRFGTFVEEWLAVQNPRGQTTENRRERLQSHILPRWRDTRLIELNWFDVEAWARTLPCAHSTTKYCVSLMSQILTGAVDARHIPHNPLAGRRLKGLPAATSGKRKERPEDMWAPPETVLQLARRMGPVDGLMVLTTAFIGLRFEEASGLHRRNALLTRSQKHDGGVFECSLVRVDGSEGALAQYFRYDEQAKRRTFHGLEPPKNATSARDIDVPPFLADLLARHLDAWPFDFVFTAPKGGWWWRSSWCARLRPAADGRKARPGGHGHPPLEKWEPIMPGLDMRALRHSHDTYQADINVHPVLAHEQAGHKYPGIKGIYQHPTPSMRVHRLEGLQGLYERALGNLGWESVWGS
ncbi:hypothetical protein ACIRF8_15015 [Streptomyces sp. NPDC102406]|uniref:hypothetical protein n=1 Tax=Streptomyces sp. NPDC102406 TaxID=3366171 RepID=UPI0038018039